MLSIVYDHQIFSWQRYGGISRYICELSNVLCQYPDIDVRVLAGLYVNEYLKQANSGLVVGVPAPKLPKAGKLLQSINTNLSRLLLSMNPPDIVHETFYSLDAIATNSSRVILTVHDLIAERFYPDDSMTLRKAQAIRRADHLICISQNTKRDLIDFFDINSQNISVIYHGCSLTNSAAASSCVASPEGDTSYILYVGDRYGYKNFDRLLVAYASSKTLKKDFRLVCFGGLPLSVQELEFATQLGIPKNHLSRISGDDALLSRFYKGASAFVYPSYYEGFGIPLVEAMTLGCPVICSHSSSFPEVVGDAAEFFDPYDSDSIAIALETVLYSAERSEELKVLGQKRASLFTWDSCAEETYKVYQSLL